MDLVKLVIRGISYSQTQVGAYALILEEEFGDKKLPIIIGSFEAQSIALALEKDLVPPRPMTHDLFYNFSKLAHIEVTSVCIYKLEEGVFYSNLVCKNLVDEEFTVDSRTSDAIALAVRFKAPIFALQSVIEKAGIELDMLSDDDDTDVQSVLKDIEKELSNIVEVNEVSLEDLSDENLESLLEEAITNEEYEQAAKIRDLLDKRSAK